MLTCSFAGNASLPVKRPLPPPQVNRTPRGASEKSYRSKYRDKYDDGSSSDRSYSTKNFSERNFKPPTYREAIRHDSESSADEHTFVQADESHQQTVFIERVIEPRVKKKTADSSFAQRAPPAPEDDMEYDSIEPKKDRKPLMVDKEVEHNSEEDDTEESDEDNEEEESGSEEESEEEGGESDTGDKPDTVYSKPNKTQDKTSKTKDNQNQGQTQPVGFRPPNPQQFQSGPYPGAFVPAGVHQPQARYGYQGQPPTQPFMPGQQPYMQGQPYTQGQPYPQGQSYPNIQQPLPSVKPSQPSSYHQANFTVPLQTQQPMSQTHQPHQGHHHSHKPHNTGKQANPPANIPVYSYLVNRGYQPLDGRYSPVSTSTGGSNLSGDRNLHHEDSDFSANLGSGVELMKRK